MQYTYIRQFEISKVTLGTVQMGMDYGIANKTGMPGEKESFGILKAAIDGGINSFDTAELYGDSEAILGKYFTSNEGIDRQPVITTKFRITLCEYESTRNIEKQIYEHVEKSLQRLKIKKIPVYMLHISKDMIDMTLYGKIISTTLEKLKKEGVIEKAGISAYTSGEVDEMLKEDVYETIQIPMNIMDHRLINSGSLKKLKAANIIVFARSVFLQGLFFLRPEELAGNLKGTEKLIRQVNLLAENEGISVAQLALLYIRDMEGITSLVLGAETQEQVRENIKLMDAPSIKENTRNKIREVFAGVPEEILNPRLWNIK